jgi:hypothetical protein
MSSGHALDTRDVGQAHQQHVIAGRDHGSSIHHAVIINAGVEEELIAIQARGNPVIFQYVIEIGRTPFA